MSVKNKRIIKLTEPTTVLNDNDEIITIVLPQGAKFNSGCSHPEYMLSQCKDGGTYCLSCRKKLGSTLEIITTIVTN